MKSITACAALVLLAAGLTAQNLVPNPGFEQHRSFDCYGCYLDPVKFEHLMMGWQDLNTNPILCDCQYNPSADEGKYDNCQAEPASGCSMMQLEYLARCTDWDRKSNGCSSYLGQSLAETLQVGQVYELAFQLYIPTQSGDLDMPHQIGLALYPKPVSNPNSGMLRSAGFLVDTVIYNQWYRVSWRIRPVCELSYLALGVFRTADWPRVHQSEFHQKFYVDDLSVKAVDAQPTDSVTVFCHPPDWEERVEVPQMEPLQCYFASGDSILRPDTQQKLDQFATWARKHPEVTFLISGHTDSIGSRHQALSTARIASVLDYLSTTHGIPILRFLSIPEGDERHQASNDTESGRQQNRRVEIRQTNYKLPMLVYRHALEAVQLEDHKLALQTLSKWLNLAPQTSKILLLFDPRVLPLREKAGWRLLEQKVLKSYAGFSQPAQAFLLDSLWAEDQRCRTLKYYIENLAVYLPRVDEGTSFWDVNFLPPADEQMQELDRLHYEHLLRLIDTTSWPRTSNIGERQAKAVFLLISHTMEEATIAHFVPLLKRSCLAGEAPWLYYATLYDRLQVIRGRPQRYATQMDTSTSVPTYFPVEEAARVNEWRQELGLSRLPDFE